MAFLKVWVGISYYQSSKETPEKSRACATDADADALLGALGMVEM